MKYNYHTHTTRCNHAMNTEREYVEAAIASGLKRLGFSDHSPYIFPEKMGNYYSGFRMRPEQAEDYCNTVRKLADEYKGQIDIRLGVEVENYPECFDETDRFLKNLGVEYYILGQHFNRNEYDGFYVANKRVPDAKTFEEYMDSVVESIKSGRFLYVAHPDLYYYPGDDDFYREQSKKVAEAAKKYNVPLEINILGLADNRHYPQKRFWEVAGEIGCSAVFGIDAHSAAQITNAKAVVERVTPDFENLGIKIVEVEL